MYFVHKFLLRYYQKCNIHKSTNVPIPIYLFNEQHHQMWPLTHKQNFQNKNFSYVKTPVAITTQHRLRLRKYFINIHKAVHICIHVFNINLKSHKLSNIYYCRFERGNFHIFILKILTTVFLIKPH